MAAILINQELVKDPVQIIKVCPFGAVEQTGDGLQLTAACKMCRICVKKYPEVFTYVETEKQPGVDKTKWNGVAVYVDHLDGKIHPVTFELLGKARQLAEKVGHKVYCLMIGEDITAAAKELLSYGIDEVLVYDNPELKHFRIEPYTNVFEDFVGRIKPAVCLVGGTAQGRSLAPRVAARFRTGLTADCTVLDMQANTDLDQIRPAFGGNIMAHIHTPKHRPQFATVRYKIFDCPEKVAEPQGKVTVCELDSSKYESGIKVLEILAKERESGIDDAEVIVVAGRGVKKEEDMRLIEELADCLNAEIAATRTLIECGWVDARRQIGLSGRTVKPKLIITCGVSGAIQFIAGMSGAEHIIAINQDSAAPIFEVAHLGIVEDLYEVIPTLIEAVKKGESIFRTRPDEVAV
ncbi:electron transfer flavoprotein subunit alpha/FixB family protein [Lentisphaerota bacterium ZTH]|nr:electron transfer flavoprotein subunit alpha/FixB family protein [Lentisphaerota bacterium]WET07229.1 electron transfer flavoprotein subunit alpha/FixB family protein [Lentisphaerota bacterium ZTH]